MSRLNLIDKDALMDKISVFFERNEELIDPSVMDCAEEIIEQAESVDAVEVVHGEWEVVDQEEPRRYGCSVCKRLSFDVTNYCSYCGAKMDGERRE
ncbi:MAG: hypothetical protein IIZ94_06720 [Prevotella sp.]|nr:hypothetical protein [Prevotella sp.]